MESDCCVEIGWKRAGGGADASSSCDERIARRNGCENCGAPLKKACAKGPRRLRGGTREGGCATDEILVVHARMEPVASLARGRSGGRRRRREAAAIVAEQLHHAQVKHGVGDGLVVEPTLLAVAQVHAERPLQRLRDGARQRGRLLGRLGAARDLAGLEVDVEHLLLNRLLGEGGRVAGEETEHVRHRRTRVREHRRRKDGDENMLPGERVKQRERRVRARGDVTPPAANEDDSLLEQQGAKEPHRVWHPERGEQRLE